jgi:geranylgeranyl pyrophosphate synthase
MRHEAGRAALRARFDEAFAAEVARRYAGDGALETACRYALEGGGKRVRPLVCLLAAQAFGGSVEGALPAAIALEMAHTYSLVHDDLPCMDDDDLRRGRPTVHKVFGEATALLVGDALLTDAFAVVADAPGLDAARRVALVRELASAAGGRGMVRGQALDLHWTARAGATAVDLDEVHALKTGRLLGAAAAMGAVSAGAEASASAAFRRFGALVGLAFQIRDDLLDERGGTGKSPGKDREQGKLTYLAVMSAPEAARAAARVTDEARGAIAGVGADTEPLVAFATELLERVQ